MGGVRGEIGAWGHLPAGRSEDDLRSRTGPHYDDLPLNSIDASLDSRVAALYSGRIEEVICA
jgi:hypothetical protein